MAGFKYENKADLALGYNVAASIPLDSRCVIDTYAHLTSGGTWTTAFNEKGQTNKAYKGMLVAVVEDPDANNNGIYEFIGNPNQHEGDTSKWKKLTLQDDMNIIDCGEY